MKDKLFIFLTIALLLLFVLSILENTSLFSGSPEGKKDVVSVRQIADGESGNFKASNVMVRLKKAGLEPREAKYYRVIDE